eukprot:g11237.t1
MAINTRVVSEAMYGWYLLSRRGAEAGVMAKAAPVSTFYDVKQPPEDFPGKSFMAVLGGFERDLVGLDRAFAWCEPHGHNAVDSEHIFTFE